MSSNTNWTTVIPGRLVLPGLPTAVVMGFFGGGGLGFFFLFVVVVGFFF